MRGSIRLAAQCSCVPVNSDVMPHDKPVTVRTPQSLVLGIAGLGQVGGHIVAIDGFMGAGKTNLSFEVAELLNGFRVGLDSYVDRDREVADYLEKLRLEHLSRDLGNLQRWFPYVVVEGIRVLDVLERLGQEPTSQVYVKRISTVGIWHDGLDLEDFEDGAVVEDDWLRRDQLTYHARRSPHISPDFLFERHEA